MTAYVIVEVEIKDPVAYAEYRDLVPPSLEPYGGRFLVRGGKVEGLEGEWNPGRMVVIGFPALEDARRWHGSPEYARAKGIRQRSAVSKMLVVEGVEA